MRYIATDTLNNIEKDVLRIADAAVADSAQVDRPAAESARAGLVDIWLPLLKENRTRCERVLNLFTDRDSRVEYVREIAFKLFQKSFGPLFAVDHTDGMAFEYIDSYDAVITDLLAKGELPALHNADKRNLYQFLKTTYIFEQYRHVPLVEVRPNDVFLDCGACYGDVSLWAARCGAKKVYAFEPEPENFRLLLQNISDFGPPGVIEAESLALGQEKGTLKFSSNISSSRFNSDGDISVEVVILDDWCKENGERGEVRPDFIKMDLEGAEPLALAGGRRTIASNRPRLAISIYHNFSDLWEIPLILAETCSDYAFYCKKHHPIHECILYAVNADERKG